MDNLIDSVYDIIDVYREEYRRKRDYLRISMKVKKLRHMIECKYPTKLRATYETYMLFDNLKWDIFDHINLFHHREFEDFYLYEQCTYKLIDRVYGK